jgi:fructose-specific phosphotransferase system IIC component
MFAAHIRRILCGLVLAILVFGAGGAAAGTVAMILVASITAQVGGVWPLFLLQIGAQGGAVVGIVWGICLICSEWDAFVGHMTWVPPVQRSAQRTA